jgi:hypothetical protein
MAGYRCENCYTEENMDGEKIDKDKVRHVKTGRGTAETLAKIHAIKTGHNPTVFGEKDGS